MAGAAASSIMSALARASTRASTSGRSSPAPIPPPRRAHGNARLPRRSTASSSSTRSVALAAARDESPIRDGDDAAPKTPTLREASKKFSEDFWDEVGKSRGGVPMLRRVNEQLDEERDALMRGDADPSRASSTTGDTPSTDPDARDASTTTTEAVARQPEGFWTRCTVGGLLIAVVFWWWGLTGMHWPTVRWVLAHPNALLWSGDLGWSVAREVGLRLGASALRCGVAWCAMRSHWRVMFALGVFASACPTAGAT